RHGGDFRAPGSGPRAGEPEHGSGSSGALKKIRRPGRAGRGGPGRRWSGSVAARPKQGQEESMVSINRLFLIGNLARDPELRYTPQGKALCELVLAVDGKSGAESEKSTSFIPITVWEKN